MASPRFGNTETRENRIQRAIGVGVTGVAVPAYGPEDWNTIRALVSAQAPRPDAMAQVQWVGGAGIHPWWVDEHSDEAFEAALAGLSAALDHVTFVGECGLDFARQGVEEGRARQLRAVSRQLEVARARGRGSVLHCVRAHPALLELLDERATPPCVLHGFSGSAELADAYVRRGHFISFCGSVTLPNARKIRAAARSVPDSMLLIETDSPDQTPVSRRPGPNEPAFLVDVAREVAALRQTDLATLASLTYDNALRAFGLS